VWTGRTFGQRQRCVDGALSVSAARRRRGGGGGGGGGGAQTRTTAAGDQLDSVGRHAHDPTPRRLRHVQTVVDGTHGHVRRTATHTQTARSQLTRQQASQSLLSTQARRQEMKWGGVFFCKKSGKWGCKTWTFSQRRVHYVQYQYFYFTFYLPVFAPAQRTPCLRACYGALLKRTDIELGGTSIIFDPSPVPGRYISPLE